MSPQRKKRLRQSTRTTHKNQSHHRIGHTCDAIPITPALAHASEAHGNKAFQLRRLRAAVPSDRSRDRSPAPDRHRRAHPSPERLTRVRPRARKQITPLLTQPTRVRRTRTRTRRLERVRQKKAKEDSHLPTLNRPSSTTYRHTFHLHSPPNQAWHHHQTFR